MFGSKLRMELILYQGMVTKKLIRTKKMLELEGVSLDLCSWSKTHSAFQTQETTFIKKQASVLKSSIDIFNQHRHEVSDPQDKYLYLHPPTSE